VRTQQAVRDEIDALNRGDLAAVLSYYTEDVLFEDVTVPERFEGKDALRGFMAAFYAAFPDLHVHVRSLIGEGSLVAAEYDLSGTHRGIFLGLDPTGRWFTVRAVSVYEHNGSRFTRETVYYDSASLLKQLTG
jgi:steroid delta-isomerase-like uncharacterized protein